MFNDVIRYKMRFRLKGGYKSLDLFNVGVIGVFVISILMFCNYSDFYNLDLFLLSFIALFFTANSFLSNKYNAATKYGLISFAFILLACKFFFTDSLYFIFVKSLFLVLVYFFFYKNLKAKDTLIVERLYIQFIFCFFIIKYLVINVLAAISNESSFDLKSLHLAFNVCLAVISFFTFCIDIVIKIKRNHCERVPMMKKDNHIGINIKGGNTYCNSVESEILEKRILDFFELEKSYLTFNFSLDMLAKYLGVPASTVSNVINNRLHTSFYKLLASYRIKYAKEIIVKEEDITFEFISESCGFKSKSTFNKYFSMIVGLSPSEFKNSLK